MKALTVVLALSLGQAPYWAGVVMGKYGNNAPPLVTILCAAVMFASCALITRSVLLARERA